MDKCNQCGNTEQFYVKTRITGNANYNYRFDGEEADNSNLHEHLNYKTGVLVYCESCDFCLGKKDDT